MKKIEIRPGRTVSKIGILFGIIGILFGILWIVLLLNLSSRDDGLEPGVIVLLVFGTMFIIAAIAVTAFYAKNAFGQKRPPLWDVENGDGERTSPTDSADGTTERRQDSVFCPYCGKALKKEHAHCRYCGKKLE